MSRESPSILSAVPTVDVVAVLAARRGSVSVIDLRTPGEFAQDHVPGACNLPLFDDVQRAIVGTLYKQHSPQAAFEQGRVFGRERIGALVAEIAAIAGWEVPEAELELRFDAATAGGIEQLETRLEDRPESRSGAALPHAAVVLHCWRGGLRSKSVVAFLRALGLERAVGLEGGYKAYRARVRAELDTWRGPRPFVLRGLTGVGKTLCLRELEALRPGWTLDLEGCANHRGSLLGMVGLEPVSQKRFDGRIAERLRERGVLGAAGGPLVLEGESRKVGDSVLPRAIWAALDSGENLLLEAPLERRVRVLAADYLARPSDRVQLARQLALVEARMGRAKFGGVLTDLLRRDAIDELVGLLLERYYDPLYRASESGRSYARTIDASDPEGAANEIATWIETARGGLR